MLLSFRLVVFICYCSAFCISSAWTAPILDQRQNGSGQPQTVTKVQVIDTPEGPMTQTCVITLTPITDSSGKPAVKEVENCDLAPGPPRSPVPSSSSTPIASSPALPPVSQSPSPSASTSTSTPSGKPTSTASPSSSALSIPSSSSAPLPASSTSPSPSASTHTSLSSTGTSAPVSTASEAPANQASASPTAKFQLPGKNLSVLPIGLGVFAGIVVIALIVVGLVTYERTRYRKAFRQRRLADMGASTGFGGGMSQV